MRSLFITGTDTGVGKTIVSAWLALHWQAAYWKPIQSGLEQGSDSHTVAYLSDAHCYPEAWRLKAALSPHQAAADEGLRISTNNIYLPITDNRQRLIVEGAGGLLTPLNESACIADLIAQLNLPVLLVARSSLGTINHTCLTVEALLARKLALIGVIMVGELHEQNRIAIEHYAKVPVLATLPWLQKVSRVQLQQCTLSEQLHTALNKLNDLDKE